MKSRRNQTIGDFLRPKSTHAPCIVDCSGIPAEICARTARKISLSLSLVGECVLCERDGGDIGWEGESGEEVKRQCDVAFGEFAVVSCSHFYFLFICLYYTLFLDIFLLLFSFLHFFFRQLILI